MLSEKCFVAFYVFSFPLGVYVGTLHVNLIASIPGLSIFTLQKFDNLFREQHNKNRDKHKGNKLASLKRNQ